MKTQYYSLKKANENIYYTLKTTIWAPISTDIQKTSEQPNTSLPILPTKAVNITDASYYQIYCGLTEALDKNQILSPIHSFNWLVIPQISIKQTSDFSCSFTLECKGKTWLCTHPWQTLVHIPAESLKLHKITSYTSDNYSSLWEGTKTWSCNPLSTPKG